MKRSLITYSALKLFADCRKAFKYRYINKIIPQIKSEALVFGSIIHDCLEEWYTNYDKHEIKKRVKNLCYEYKYSNIKLAILAMMDGYIKTYKTEKFEIIALEKHFTGPIINPKTGLESESLYMGGKIDGIVKQADKYYILEHKTTSVINTGYIKKLPIDFQILLYSIYANNLYPETPMAGIIYNILTKAKLRKRVPEISNRDYYFRLCNKYSRSGMFKRERISIDSHYILQLKKNVWKLSEAIVRACKMNNFYSNNSHCFKWNRPCDYYILCYSNYDNYKHLFENLYKYAEAHNELGKLQEEYQPLSDLINE